jgi:hypothetical protein
MLVALLDSVAGEAHDLVGEDRARDQREVMLDDRAVDPHARAVAQHAVRQLGDPVLGRRPASRRMRSGAR